jgi:UDP-N-acetylglucosamine 2-epimerase (non-hydrolysing)
MSEVFFADMRIPEPDVYLGVGLGSHGTQTGAMLAALDAVLGEHKPDWVLVVAGPILLVVVALGAATGRRAVALL